MATARVRKIAPGLSQILPLPYGPFGRVRREPLVFFLEQMYRFGDVFRFQVGPVITHAVYHPRHVKQVLQDEAKNYVRGRSFDLFRLVIGNGLAASDGELWQRQRRMIQPAFQRQRLTALGGVITDAAAAMLESWRCRAEEGRPIDLAAEMTRLTLAVAGRVLFGADLGGVAGAVGASLTIVMEYLHYRLNRLLAPPAWVPIPRNLRFRRALRTLDHVVYGIIAERRRAPGGSADLLTTLLAAQDQETGARMSERQLRDEVMAFLLAGHETIATALTWTWHLLAGRPLAARRLRDEVASVLGGRTPTVNDLPNLPYTKMVVEEAMRLYPPIWLLVRNPVAAGEVGGYHIPAGSMIFLLPYCTHRHPGFWKDPEAFEPERFAPEQSAARPRYAYFPFGCGPHQCIGSEFALMEAQFVTAMIAHAFHLKPAPDSTVDRDPIFTLRSRTGIWMTVREA